MKAVIWRYAPKILESQLGRPLQTPWRIVTICKHGYPQVIASPSRFDNGELNPQWVWLTCPSLRKSIAQHEDDGKCAEATKLLEKQPELARQLMDVDAEIRRLRADEVPLCGAGDERPIDYAFEVGHSGSRNPLKVKCLHSHVAYYLAGLSDPIGEDFFKNHPRSCGAEKCAHRLPAETCTET